MAESTKKRKLKPSVTVREHAAAGTPKRTKSRRLRQATRKASAPIRYAHRIGQKQYYLPMPDTRLGRFLNKRRYWTPRFFREAWTEVKLVSWPDRRQTANLTFAVFAFAIVFGLLVAATDYGLDILFKNTVLK